MDLTIQLNGKTKSIAQTASITTILKEYKLNPFAVVVEINQTAVDKSAFDTTIINNGDCIEILQFVGGG
jgi:thiamine biosynthesis protein ThiS